MAVERTLSIIKPDAVAKNVIGQIYSRFESAGLRIIASRMFQLSEAEAQQFYGVHKDRPFFVYLPQSMPHVPLAATASSLSSLRSPCWASRWAWPR